MGMTDWIEVDGLLDTARKLVAQSEQILVREGMSESWTDELVCINDDLADYLTMFRHTWIEGD